MAKLGLCFILGILCQTNGQFPNLFKAMMGGGSGAPGGSSVPGGSGNSCLSSTISCMPWCQRSMGTNGCPVCNCGSQGGMNPMSMNPMSGGSMFSGLTGGSSPMGGGNGHQPSNCPSAPRTCMYPPPWCQRLVDENSCMKCLCGQDLINFQNSLNGKTTSAAGTSGTASTSTTTKPSPQRQSTAHVKPTPPPVQSCLLTFTCAKQCEYGYQSDSIGCPLCDCITGGPVDVPVVATDPPGKHPITVQTTSVITSDVISCPGLFSCALICNNGYKTDAVGCPKCECVV